MKKILIVSTVSRQFYLFEKSNIEVLKTLGYEVHAAANFSDIDERLNILDIIKHPFDIQRSPFSKKNVKAYKQLKKIMKKENFDMVHCHSPMGAVLTRLAAKSVGLTPVIYTAHGFHFYKGAPFMNWLFYYPVEKILSTYTDVLITINQEDYEVAKKFRTKMVTYVPGIGVDTNKFKGIVIDRDKKREELGISKNTTVILSVGELIKRKNYETALEAIANLNYQDFVYLICGRGELEEYLKDLVKSLGIERKVKFLGYRNDVPEVCIASDIFLFPSYQEGLPVSIMEAMSAGLPVICSNIRGNTDLIVDGVGGFLVDPNNAVGFTNSIQSVLDDINLQKTMKLNNLVKVKNFDKDLVKEKMRVLYTLASKEKEFI